MSHVNTDSTTVSSEGCLHIMLLVYLSIPVLIAMVIICANVTHLFNAADEDYVPLSNFQVRWQSNQIDPDPTLEFEILDDDNIEAREKFFEIELSITRNALFYPCAVGRVTIIEDDLRKLDACNCNFKIT